MKMANILIALAFTGSITLGVADSTNNSSDTKKRVEQINKLKEKLKGMDPKQKEEFLSKMKKEMKHNQNIDNHTEMEHKNSSNTQEHITEIESHLEQEHSITQNNYQNQLGNEIGHKINNEGGSIEHTNIEGNYQNYNK